MRARKYAKSSEVLDRSRSMQPKWAKTNKQYYIPRNHLSTDKYGSINNPTLIMNVRINEELLRR